MDLSNVSARTANAVVAAAALLAVLIVGGMLVDYRQDNSAAAARVASAPPRATETAEPLPGVPVEEAMSRLEQKKVPFTVAVIGDSTGAAAGGWVYQMGQWIGETYDRPVDLKPWYLGPANYGPTGALTTGTNAKVTIWNGSASGQGVTYSKSNLATMLPDGVKPDLIFFNHGHNMPEEGIFAEDADAFVMKLSTDYPDAALVVIGQNPHTGLAAKGGRGEGFQTIVDGELYWAEFYGYPTIDINALFLEQPKWQQLIDKTGIHPTVAGYKLWGDAVIEYLRSSA